MLARMNSDRMISDMINSFVATNGKDHNCACPAANIKESKEEYIIELAVPGLNKKDLKVELVKDSIVLYAEKEANANEQYVKREFDYSNFKRVYHIPEKVDKSKISATYKDGIFIVSLPKKEEAIDRGPVQIKIS